MDLIHLEHVTPEFPVSMFLSDGGFVDNLGLIGLLARQETDIISLCSGTIEEQLLFIKGAIKLARNCEYTATVLSFADVFLTDRQVFAALDRPRLQLLRSDWR